MIAIVPPARALRFDLTSMSERELRPGEHELPGAGEGFVWVDVDLAAREALDGLRAGGLLPAATDLEEGAPGRVDWAHGPDHLTLTLAVARLDGDTLVLERRGMVVTDGGVVSLHDGSPTYFDEIRAHYGDDFRRFAKSHGFLIFEMFDHLADALQRTVRSLGDRIDDLRLSASGSARAGERLDGSELLASVLVLRRMLARTRDLLAEISSRRSAFVPETTQPFLRDIGNRLDGFVADLAFSRDVLDEALRLAEPSPAAAEPARPGRPGVTVVSLGGFAVRRGDERVDLGGGGDEPAAELLAALLSAPRPVPRDQLLAWFWPDEARDRASRALTRALSSLRREVEPDRSDGSGMILVEGPLHRVVLGPQDAWDVDRLRALGAEAPAGEAIEELGEALDVYGLPFCPEWPHAEWGRAVREDCARALASLRARLAELLLAADRIDEAIGHFEALLEGDPESEAAHRGLMRGHARAGRMPLALRQYHACRSVLRQTQGIDPGPETQTLYLSLLGRP